MRVEGSGHLWSSLGEWWPVAPAWIRKGLHSYPLFAGSFHSGHCPALAGPYLGPDGVGALCEVRGWQGLLSLLL